KAKYDYHNPQTIPNEIDGMSISRSLPTEDDLEEVFLHAFNLTADDITILGNIYENPELLEGAK
ncbi:YopX family protein, partial [Enterococcus spodopteracolus]